MSEEVLDELRQLSNIIQAIENLITQCGDLEQFTVLKLQLLDVLGECQHDLWQKIHIDKN